MLTKEAIQELSAAQAIDAASRCLGIDAGEGGAVALPDDFKIHDLEPYLAVRRRVRGSMNTSSVSDFASYVVAHQEPGAMVFVSQDTMAADAVLNLGTPDHPGHADNRSTLTLKKTAAYLAMERHASGGQITQKAAAEFLEDWAPSIECMDNDGPIPTPRVISAVRAITIETMKKLESTEKQLSASRGVFEQVQANSAERMPAVINFRCVPYHGLVDRVFSLRLGIITGGDKPALSLRVINAEAHAEQMAAELAQLVRSSLQDKVLVLQGSYRATA